MINIGVIGSGFGLYGHLPAFNTLANCKLKAICGKKTDRLLEYCKSIGLEKIYSDWREMIFLEDIEALCIAVNPKSQFDIAFEAINQGLNIFAEKPLAPNYKEAKILLDLSQKKGIVTSIDFIFPEIGEWRKVKEILEAKQLGKLLNVKVKWKFLSYDIKNNLQTWKTDTQMGGGALSYFFSHTFYYLQYFISSKISNVWGTIESTDFNQIQIETGAKLNFAFENNVTVSAELSANYAKSPLHILEFNCEKGQILLENLGLSVTDFKITINNINGNIIFLKLDSLSDEIDERVPYVKKIAERFLNCCETNNEMIPSFNDGVEVHRIIELIRKNCKK